MKFTGRLLKNGHLRRYPVPFGDVARSHSLFVATPLSGFRGLCIWPFLSNPEKMIFSAACLYSVSRSSSAVPESRSGRDISIALQRGHLPPPALSGPFYKSFEITLQLCWDRLPSPLGKRGRGREGGKKERKYLRTLDALLLCCGVLHFGSREAASHHIGILDFSRTSVII